MNYHQSNLESLFKHFSSAPTGLSSQQARQQIKKYGLNRLQVKGRPWWHRIIAPFLNVFMLILAVAAIVSISTHEVLDGGIIIFIMAASAAIDYIQQHTSERIFKTLRRFDTQTIEVVRDGTLVTLNADQLVPGDCIELREGQKVPADCRLIEADALRANESLLTGESLPISKQALSLAEPKPIYEQTNMLFSGSFIISGRAKALVVATGNATEFGRLASLTEKSTQTSPVQQKIDHLITQITIGVGVVSIALFILSLYRGVGLAESIRFVLTLAVSAVPEGLPVAISVVLVVGARRLAKHQALIRNLAAIENIGIVTTIATDKTGTLTKNQLQVQQSWPLRSHHNQPLNQAAYYAVNRQNSQIHDPLDTALNDFGQISTAPPVAQKIVQSFPFEQKLAMSGVTWKSKTTYTTYIKGAPEQILAHATISAPDRRQFEAQVLTYTQDGYRVIAIATLTHAKLPPPNLTKLLTTKLTVVGLLAIADELRPEAIQSITTTQAAGVTVRMITGDHFETAYAIGKQLGLVKTKDEVFDCRQMADIDDKKLAQIIHKTKVFSRVLPEYKHRIVTILKHQHIIAMTGDGVNDVPALTTAHIGIAMGSGSQIAKEAGDIVLLDDNFTSIVSALRQGRIVFDNIQRMLFYLLATNAGEVITMIGALLIGLPLPMLPVQILWINLATDSTLVIPLGLETAENQVMHRPPRDPRKPILGKPMITRIAIIASLMAILTIGVFVYYWQSHSTAYARTIAFNLLVVMQWANAFNSRSEWQSIFSKQFFTNPIFYLAIVISIGIQLIALFSPLQDILHLSNVSHYDLVLTGLVGIGLVILASEIHKGIGRRWQGK